MGGFGVSQQPLIRVINLDRCEDRLQHITAELAAVGLQWERLAAVEPTADGYLAHPLYRAGKAKRFHGVDLARGEIGCFLSHIEALQTFLDSGRTHLLVPEDDVDLPPDFQPFLTDLTTELKRLAWDWSCLNLSASYDKRYKSICTPAMPSFKGRTLRRAFYFPTLTSALLWSRSGAQAFLEHVRRHGMYLPVDQQLRAHLAKTGRGLSLSTPVVDLLPMPTSIEARINQRHPMARLRRNAANYGWAYLNMFCNR